MVRNLLVLLTSSLRPRVACDQPLACAFRVMPWDVGISTFKSDSYFAVAESAQADFLVRTGLFGPMLAGRMRWVNLGQAARMERPLRLFQRFEVTTQVLCVDDRHAYFSHRFGSRAGHHAQVLVKVKFKQGRITVPPQQVLGPQALEKPAAVLAMDGMLSHS
jgi:acyl-CoA thioesterase FadM